jgi:lysophospholipid hydrolase
MALITRAGLFYVVEGFLDILLPVEESRGEGTQEHKSSKPGATRLQSKSIVKGRSQEKHLFTVKPGGIAGYLGEFHEDRLLPF